MCYYYDVITGTDNRIRVFIRIERSDGALSFTCTTLGSNGRSSSLISMTDFDRKTSRHRIVLEAIRAYLSNIKPADDEKPYVLVFYAGNDEIACEWHQEYLKNGAFSSSTEDLDLYGKIIRLLDKTNVRMEIARRGNVLESIRRVLR